MPDAKSENFARGAVCRLGVEPLREREFQLVGIAHDVAVVEANDRTEVVDAARVAVTQAGLDDVFHFLA